MKRSVINLAIGTLVACGGIILLDALFLEKYFFKIRKFKIGNKRGRKKIKLALVTDLHLKNSLWPSYRRLARKLNGLKPDLLLIAGDTLDPSGQATTVERFLQLINYSIPKVAVLGNHDHLSEVDNEGFKEIYGAQNCTLLINRSKAFTLKGERLVITGLDDFIEGRSNFEKAVKHVGREDHHLLLIHSPLQQEEALSKMKAINQSRSKADRLNISYIFAGHNHGGQVTFFNFVPVLPEKSGSYINGWYNKESPYLYLSTGFGTSGVPFRFMTPSELAIFNYYI